MHGSISSGSWSFLPKKKITTSTAEAPKAPEPPKTKKIGGKEGRPTMQQYTGSPRYIQCPCTLDTEHDRLLCNDWRKNRQSGDCLYLVHKTKCWLGLR